MKNYLNNVPSGDGRYIRIDDLLALQELSFSLEKLFDNFGEPFVISGCVVSGTAPNNAVSAGVVFLDGKIHSLPAVGSVDLGSVKYIRHLSNTASDSRPLFGGGSANVFETYLAQISGTTGSDDYIEISQGAPAKTVADVIASQSDLTALLATILARTNADLTYNTGWDSYFLGVPAQYNKNSLGFVQVAGVVKHVSGGATVIGTLPSGYRPNIIKRFIVAGYNGSGTPVDAVIEVDATGDIELLSPTPAANYYFFLDSISFYTDM